MFKLLIALVSIVTISGYAKAETQTDAIKTCGVLDLKCVNDNFLQLQRELDAANALVVVLTKRLDELTNQLNDPKTGLPVLYKEVNDPKSGLTATNRETNALYQQINDPGRGLAEQIGSVTGNVAIRSVNRNGQCLEIVDPGEGRLGFVGCDNNDAYQVMKLDRR